MFRWLFIVIAVGTLVFNRRAVLGAAAVGFLLVVCTERKPFVRSFSSSVISYLGGVFLGISALAVWQLTQINEPATGEGTIIFTGLVLDQLKTDTYLIRYHAEQAVLQTSTVLAPGTTIVGKGRFTPQATLRVSRSSRQLPPLLRQKFAFDRWLAVKHLVGRLSVFPTNLRQTWIEKIPWLYALRYQVKEYISQTFPSRQLQALVLWLTTGDRSGFTKQEYKSFVESWLVHLLAVSGSNVVYLTLFLSFLLFFLPFYFRMIVIGVLVLGYGLLCGADSSVLRAVIMWVLSLGATLAWRTVQTWRLLRLAAGSMLLRNPLLLRYDLWFLLSFWAVLGILTICTWWQRGNEAETPSRFSRGIARYLLPTLGASLGVFPVLLRFTGTVSLLSILINILIVPLVPLFLVGSLFTTLTGGIGISVLEWAAHLLFGIATRSSEHGLFLTVQGGRGTLAVVGVGVCILRYLMHLTRTTASHTSND